MKRLLIFVNKFDKADDLLGFFVGWVNELAEGLDKITVITQKKGEYDQRDNVEVISLEKDKNKNPIVRSWKLNSHLFQLRGNYDGVFVIMAPAWAIVAFPAIKILRKKLYLWYAVWKGSWKLKLAEKLVDKIFSSVKEAFPFQSRKLELIGQGVDTDKFSRDRSVQDFNKILFLGRISPVKKIEVLFKALAKIREARPEIYQRLSCDIAGDVARGKDKHYLNELKRLATELNLGSKIKWLGKIPHKNTPEHYKRSGIFVNLTPVGSFDKSMLEAMACGNLILVSNSALANFLNPSFRELFIFRQDDLEELSEKLVKLLELNETDKYREELRNIIINNHSQEQWAQNFIKNTE